MAAWRDVLRGAAAAVAALAGMAAVATAGLALLDAGRIGGFGGLTAAVVALAVGGSAEFDAVRAGDLPLVVRGGVGVVPLGVTLVGTVVLGWLLLRHRDGLLVRGAAAAVTFLAGVVAVVAAARGAVTLPGGGAALPGGAAAGGGSGVCGLPEVGPFGRGGSVGALDVGFSVPLWPTLAGAVAWVCAVVGLCWLVVRFRIAVRGALRVVGGLSAVCLLAAWAAGGAMAVGGVLLVLPLVVFGVLSLGLGVPWAVRSDGPLSCVLDGVAPPAPGGSLTWVASAVLLVLGIVVALAGARDGGPLRRAARDGAVTSAVVGVPLGVLALRAGVSVELGVGAFGFSFPLLEAWAATNPLAALGMGCAGGAAAGFAGSLLVRGALRWASVSWPAWRNRSGR
ncbi:hypothetical protein JOF41_001716 [Saccharothrix coeruleofusca]|uniref:streptophobe family protein n=1 Tax=Saccharothrix coeruleofusca TaxID=33919 RepID=UPI001AEB1C82|nr:streptophobe family protein [Saccharothrix coeruleofusca]MBP2335538.1 hypothetical protein [Saccharothrix coeruleofusca]